MKPPDVDPPHLTSPDLNSRNLFPPTERMFQP